MSSPTVPTTLQQATAGGRALPLTVLQGPQAADRSIGSIGVGFRLGGEETGGQLAIVEHPFPVGALVPPHVHTREDEFSIVTAGTIGFRSGPDEVVLEAGGYIAKPRGELHTMWNAGDTEARMIEVITPAGFERFFFDLAELVEAGPPNPTDLETLATSYGLFIDPTWVPDLMHRYNLNSPFA
ncbi:quercetin dioxygenase-like cupin family protein [Kribbella voronezhensis]|uniref:Quercetin dioxygenase-like cupin family protein n=1 Tax=Kribbella voronezhensis TaxID=2512212 RepID=A0A4R7T912_9ACTN|nr:cupin domain-containing protein [Kribbella voronezhensis]TDU87667.1 quercetin dioxygenase-like cupin family protein [Kribbella voronezhensis]